MSELPAVNQGDKTVQVVRGQHHKFMLLPVMAHNAAWIEAGPVTFAVEARVLGDARGVIGERGASLHVFSADRSKEYVRFDNFQNGPHYHYILNDLQHNVVWGYDPDMNGPMLPWAISAIRNRLPALLRRAGATELAERVEREGFDASALQKVEQAMTAAWERCFPGTDMVEEGRDWYVRWKKIHPQFNTVD
jgi:hypothetical protein